MLKHFPQSGTDLFLYLFNLSWSLHFFPSIYKSSTVIPIHKMGKSLYSPASFLLNTFTSCTSKLFERIILSRLLFFLGSNSILSPHQAGIRPERSTLNQILFLFQFISDGFNEPRQGSRTIPFYNRLLQGFRLFLASRPFLFNAFTDQLIAPSPAASLPVSPIPPLYLPMSHLDSFCPVL